MIHEKPYLSHLATLKSENRVERIGSDRDGYWRVKFRSLVLTREEFKAFLPTLQNRPNYLVWERQGDT
jgi:hypothetical protein